ncbi:MAG: FAD:protein FMN transferase [Planctomycetia bacterium]|nr:FAD:protein FMN transferase [Planctomycetia bacterium]
MDRRNFITGSFLPPADTEQVVSTGKAEYVQIRRRAMAAEFVIFVNAGEYRDAVETSLDALDEVTRLEKLLSYFDEESEIFRINQWAAGGFLSTDAEVYGLLRQCDALYRATDGAFDMTATPLAKAWGFMRRKGTVPDEATRCSAMACVGGDKIDWDDGNRSLRFHVSGMEISLGSIGKGFAIDAAAGVLEAAGMENFLIHGGNSSVLARGARRGRTDWLVGLHHPLKPSSRLMEIPVRDRAVGTSGSATQFFWHEGKRYGHVLDPRTGFPAQGVLSVSVLAGTATEADALATAFYVMGVEKTRAFCETRPDLGVVFVTDRQEVISMGNLG